jgi:hypothetical protein
MAPDGDVVLAGDTTGVISTASQANQGGADALVMRISPDLQIVRWARMIGTAADESASALDVFADGSVAIGGWTQGAMFSAYAGGDDQFILKLAPSGSLVWGRQYGGGGIDEAFGVVALASGGIAFAGYSTSATIYGEAGLGGVDVTVASTDASGAMTWGHRFGGSGSDFGFAATTDGNGGIVVVGGSTTGLFAPAAGASDFIVARYDASGNRLWGRQLGTTATDEGYFATTTSTGDLVVGGVSGGTLGGSFAGVYDIIAMKYAPDGSRY